MKTTQRLRSPSCGREHPEKAVVTQRIAEDAVARLQVLLDLGLGYLSLERSTPTLSPGELQRLRLATQVRSNLFGVVYVLDEPSAGLHPDDTEALLARWTRLKASGNSLFVVEHEVDVIRHADWIVDVGPGAGEQGGRVLYSGPPAGLAGVAQSSTARHLFGGQAPRRARDAHAARLAAPRRRDPQQPASAGRDVSPGRVHERHRHLRLRQVQPGQPGAGRAGRGAPGPAADARCQRRRRRRALEQTRPVVDTRRREAVERRARGRIKRLVRVDQRPIGRTPRSNLATYTGLFDHVRKIFAATPARGPVTTTPGASRSTWQGALRDLRR